MHAQRLHSLDNLRAIMMWLGIVLHVAVNHITTRSPLPWRDAETTQWADFTLLLIHAFRMPVFFILAGFFVAMLAARRGYGGMLRHRLRRIGLPFAVFWPPIFVATVVLVMLYVHLMARGTLGLDATLIPPNPNQPMISTLHMWFIYYLLWFCLVTALIGRFSGHIAPVLKAGATKAWTVLATKPWGFAVLAAPLAVVGSFWPAGILPASGSFVPTLGESVHYGLFFVFGWYMYGNQTRVLDLYARHCWRYTLAGLVFFCGYLGAMAALKVDPQKMTDNQLWLAFAYACVSWLWSFALLGIFVRYLQHQNGFLRYVSESSYWVYLVHMLGTIGFGVLLYRAPLGAISKMGINIAATTLVCLATYQLLVRYTPIGTLLTGLRRRRVQEKDQAQAHS